METQFTREKAESDLYSLYENAIAHLESGDLLSGDSILTSLINNPLLSTLQDPDFKYSIYLTLANAKESQNFIDEALYFYHKANKLKNNVDSSLWLKLALLCEKQRYFSQADQCYQECLKFSKGVAFEKVLYEKMISMGFLANEWDNVIKRLDYLRKSSPLSEEMLAIRCYVFLKSGNYELYEQNFREGMQRNPHYNIENFKIIQEIKELEKIKKQAVSTKKKEEPKNHEKEFCIFLDKNSWITCLEILVYIVKVFRFKITGTNLKAKYKKNKYKSYIEHISHLSLSESEILFKEKKENFFKLPSKYKKSTKPIPLVNSEILLPENTQMDIESTKIPFPTEEPKKSNDFGVIMNEEEPILEKTPEENARKGAEENQIINEFNPETINENKQNDLENKQPKKTKKDSINIDNIPDLRGKSKRIQSIKTSEMTINEYASLFIKKKSTSLEAKLQEFRSNSCIPSEILKRFSSVFKIFFPKDLRESESLEEQEKDNKNEAKPADDKSLKRSCNNDFAAFLHKSKKFPSFLTLIQEIFENFLVNKPRNYSSPPEFIKRLKENSPESLIFTPNPILFQLEIRKWLIKLFFSLFSFTKPTFKNLETKLTLFELVFDYYLEKKANISGVSSEKNHKKLTLMRYVLQEISSEFLLQDFSAEIQGKERILLRIRAFHMLAIFHSYKDFEAIHLAKYSLELLKKNLAVFLGQNIENSKENSVFLNLFWMNCKVLDQSFFELAEERISDIGKPLDQLEGENLGMKLMKYLDLFNEKTNYSLEDALDLYFRQIFELTFLEKLQQIYFCKSAVMMIKIFCNILNRRKLLLEDLRKDFFKFIECLKLERIISGISEKLSEIHLLNEICELFFSLTKLIILMMSVFSAEILKDSAFVQTTIKAMTHLFHLLCQNSLIEQNFIISTYELLHYFIDNILEATVIQHQKLFPLALRKILLQIIFARMDQKMDENQIFEEISQFFMCFYGVNNPKKVDISEFESENDPESSLISDINEIGFFVKFISLFHEDYLELNPPKFKPSIQTFLISSFEFLKQNNETWILCPQLTKFVDEDLKNYLETGEMAHLTSLFLVRKGEFLEGCNENKQEKSSGNANNSNCLCEKSCFPNNSEMIYFYEKGFFLLGKAFLEQQDNDNVKVKKSNLKKAEKMFQINVCLNPYDLKSWLFLARLYRDMGFLYIDQAIYNIIQNKMEEIEGANFKFERIFQKIFLQMDPNDMSSKLINIEMRDNLIVFYILELMQRKFKWMKGETQRIDYFNSQQDIFNKIDDIKFSEENLKGLYLKEIFVKRKKLNEFNSETHHGHLKNLVDIRRKIEKLLIDQDIDYKDESSLIEIEAEILISIWKIAKRYLKLLDFVKNYDLEKAPKQVSDVFSQLNCKEKSDIRNYVEQNFLFFLFNLQDIDKENSLELADLVEIQKELTSNSSFESNTHEIPFDYRLYDSEKKEDLEKIMTMLKNIIKSQESKLKIYVDCKNNMTFFILRFLDVLLVKISRAIGKYNKKYRYYRSYVLLCYYSAKIFNFLHGIEKYNEAIKTFQISRSQTSIWSFTAGDTTQFDKFLKPFDELFSIKTYELVEVYKKERDPLLCSLFHRDLMFLLLKIKLIKMKSNLSTKKIADLDKLRLLNKKIAKLMLVPYNPTEIIIINEPLFNAYWITLKELLIGIKEFILAENTKEFNLCKWIDDLLITIVKQKGIQKILKEKKIDIYSSFEQILVMGFKIANPGENFEESKELEEKALNYFNSLHNKRKKKKNPEENQPEIIE